MRVSPFSCSQQEFGYLEIPSFHLPANFNTKCYSLAESADVRPYASGRTQQAVPLGRGGVVEPRAPSCDDDDNHSSWEESPPRVASTEPVSHGASRYLKRSRAPSVGRYKEKAELSALPLTSPAV